MSIGTRGSSAGTANNVLTFTTLQIARIFFMQSSSTNTFEIQGNDIPGTMRIVRTNGTILDIPASANWRNSGGTTYLIGFLPRPVAPITLTYSGGSIQITDGAVNGGSSIGGYAAAYAGAKLADGESDNGNAAMGQVLDGLNAYLATVIASRPPGPVTVTTLSTSSTTPTLSGTATVGAGEALTVVVNGVQYSTSTSPAIVRTGTSWSLTLTTPLSIGSYQVAATITNTNGFTLSDTSTNELTITQATTTLTIGGSFTANNKVYSGDTTATGTTTGLTLLGVNGSDNVTIASVTLSFLTAPVGTAKSVVITGVTLGGTNAGLYTVSLTGAPTASANITPKPLTIGGGFTASNKVTDGNTSATIATNSLTLVGVVSPDMVTLSSVTATFATATVGNGKTVSLSAATIGGTNSGNYSIGVSGAPTTTADITTAGGTLTISGSFTANNKVYSGDTTATGTTTGLTLVGVNGSDNVTIASVTLGFLTAPVGTAKNVVITGVTLGGTDAGLYTVSLTGAPTASANITPKPLTITGSFTANNKVFDTNTSATIATNSLTLVGVVSPDVVTLSSVTATFATATVGNGKTVSLSAATIGGTNSGNYTVGVSGAPTTTANITSAGGTVTISGSFTANNKVYSGDTTATGTTTSLTLVGVNGGDNVTIVSVTLGFLTSPVGTAKSVVITGVTLGGTNAGLYTVSLAGAPTATANITPKPLTIGGSFTASNKVFDTNTLATIATNSLTLVGVVSPDVVMLSGVTATFGTASVGNGKTVSLSAATIGGTNGGNYSIGVAGAPTTTANITTAGGTVTIGGSFTANNKVYSGTTSATGNTSALTLVGVSGGDQVTIASVTIAFTTASVGSARTVVIRGVTLAGEHGALYTVNLTGAPTTTASITPIALTIGGSFEATEKIYDGTTTVTIASNALALIGVRNGDNVILTGVTFAFADPAVGTQKTVGIISAALGGSAAASYTLILNGAPVATASILAATPPTVPRTVVGVAGDGRITLTFGLPANEGCRAVTGYVVESSTDNGATWQRTLLSGRTLTSWVLQGLTNNVATRVRVAAVNTCGVSPFVEAPGPLVPIGPTRTTGGQPTTAPRGTGTLSSSNTPVTIEVVRDTALRLSDGTVTLTLRSSDASESAIPIDSNRAMQLDQGGRATTEGSGFAPGTYVSVFIYAPNGTPMLLGMVVVGNDGTFRVTVPIPAALPPGDYTLQVNGIDRTLTPRSASLGVELAEPPADVELTAVPDQLSPAVGDTITITLTVLNTGAGPAINVIIPRAFSEAGFTIVKTTPIDGSYNDLTRQWTIPRIEPGARARLLLTAIVLPPAALQPNTP